MYTYIYMCVCMWSVCVWSVCVCKYIYVYIYIFMYTHIGQNLYICAYMCILYI